MLTKTDASSRARRLEDLNNLVARDEQACLRLLEEQLLSMGGRCSPELLEHYDCLRTSWNAKLESEGMNP